MERQKKDPTFTDKARRLLAQRREIPFSDVPGIGRMTTESTNPQHFGPDDFWCFGDDSRRLMQE